MCTKNKSCNFHTSPSMKGKISRTNYSQSWKHCILLASERSERDTLRSVQLRIADIYINIYTRRMVPIMGRASLIAEVILYVR